MLAMHYAVPLHGADQIEAIRERVASKGPAFNAVDGLAGKVFLLGSAPSTYSLYYLWRDMDAMEAFLTGPLFAALAASFGRPVVKTYFADATRFSFQPGERIALMAGDVSGGEGGVSFFDPYYGKRFRLATTADGSFECLYVAAAVSQA